MWHRHVKTLIPAPVMHGYAQERTYRKFTVHSSGTIFSSPGGSPGRAIVLPLASALTAAALAKC